MLLPSNRHIVTQHFLQRRSPQRDVLMPSMHPPLSLVFANQSALSLFRDGCHKHKMAQILPHFQSDSRIVGLGTATFNIFNSLESITNLLHSPLPKNEPHSSNRNKVPRVNPPSTAAQNSTRYSSQSVFSGRFESLHPSESHGRQY